MSSDATAQREGGLPDEVVIFGGGGSRTFHRRARGDEVRPVCGTPGRNPLVKERALVDGHYTPCKRCFPLSKGGRQ